MKRIILKYQDFLNENYTFNINKYTNFSNLTPSDLKDIAEWGLTSEFSESGVYDYCDECQECKDCPECKECVINEIVGSFNNILNKDFPEGFKNIPNPIPIYRMVKLNTPSELNKTNFGFSWFTNPDRIDNPYFIQKLEHLRGNKTYLIVGETDISNVDIPRTLWLRDVDYMENEIKIKDDTKVNFIELKKL